ncbi:MAG: FHA domain-containing protein [Acidobacteria bacterium]|nr:FHA domain-containing protein [Acidobacteriota bacterium]
MKEYIIINHLIGSKSGQVEGFLISNFSEITIGRSSSSTLKFDKQKDSMVSTHQAKILISTTKPYQFSLLDLNSRNGTFLNKRRAIGAVTLKVGDIIQAGLDGPAFEFDLNPRPSALSSHIPSIGTIKRLVLEHIAGSKTGQLEFISLNDFRELIIGRGETSMIKYDIYQDYMLSREHAKITVDSKNPQKFTITDLDSRNGTFLNKAKLLGSAPLNFGDIVQFGVEGPAFRFDLQ